MTYYRLAVALALFLAAAGLKYYLPEAAEVTLPALDALIDRQDAALPLPEEALAWLDWR